MTPEVEFGIWLNRRRSRWQDAWSATYGALIAGGLIEPPLEFCKANSDGEGEALVMKMQLTRAS